MDELSKALRTIQRCGVNLSEINLSFLSIENLKSLQANISKTIEEKKKLKIPVSMRNKEGLYKLLPDRKIKAIKEWRSFTGWNIRDSKIAVEILQLNYACLKEFEMDLNEYIDHIDNLVGNNNTVYKNNLILIKTLKHVYNNHIDPSFGFSGTRRLTSFARRNPGVIYLEPGGTIPAQLWDSQDPDSSELEGSVLDHFSLSPGSLGPPLKGTGIAENI